VGQFYNLNTQGDMVNMSKKPVGAAAVIMDSDERILLVKHTTGNIIGKYLVGYLRKMSLRRIPQREKCLKRRDLKLLSGV